MKVRNWIACVALVMVCACRAIRCVRMMPTRRRSKESPHRISHARRWTEKISSSRPQRGRGDDRLLGHVVPTLPRRRCRM